MSFLLKDILDTLPDEDTTNYRIQNKLLFKELNKTCVVIDDDPTGNQTVYNIPLLTQSTIETIENEFKNGTPIFFILTNSRSLTVEKSAEIYSEITKTIQKASQNTNRSFSIISRSDSTLRGHFPSEIDAIKQNRDLYNSITVLIPVMFEGGRVTLNNTHYILEQDNLVPVNETPFSKDKSFGYSNANLKEWIEEKTKGVIKSSDVFSISLEAIRTLKANALCKIINDIPHGNYCIFNALNYQDLDKVSNALLLAEKQGKKIAYRTSSSFVPSYIGLEPKPLLTAYNLIDSNASNGGLTIVGSYVPKSSEQLKNVISSFNKECIFEIKVDEILGNNNENYLMEVSKAIDVQLNNGFNVLVFTSRKLISGASASENLDIGEKVSNALVKLIQQLKERPKYIIAKGGITSHDLAIKGLGMERSKVLGQIIPGVPVWEMGKETKFPKLTYIVFPGNVGDDKSLLKVIQKLK